MNVRIALTIALVALLTGCAGITDVIQKREQLYGAKPLNVESPAPAAYALAAAAARTAYSSSIAAQPTTIPGYVDAGIAAANANCRAWLLAVSAAEQRWRQGETNANVIMALITGVLGAANVHHDVITAYGLGSAAVQGYSQGFLSNVLGMADYDLQVKVREAMGARARELRAQAGGFTYPQAVDAIEDYGALCTPQAAKALSRSALTAVTTTVAPSGAVATEPSPAATAAIAGVTAAFSKDDSGERIVQYWSPGDVVNPAHEKQLRAWLDAHGFPVSVVFFSHSKLHAEARKQLIADLNIPELSK